MSPGLQPADVLTTLLPGFSGTTLPDWLRRRLEEGLGGVCLFARNIADHAQLAALDAEILDANPLAVIAVDEEGGDVTRLSADVGSPFPGNAVLGRLDDVELTAAVASEVGWALRRTGCTWTFAPSVDVNANPDNPVIGVRSFGADPALVARHGAAWVRGVQATGIVATAKHFPGHGDTAQDSHVALPVVDRSLDELRARELVPFEAAIAVGASSVMTSHILLPQVDPAAPATFSHRVITGLLRDELGFDGVVVTDALDMAGATSPGGPPESAVRALAAGCDLLCLGNDTTEVQIDAIVVAVQGALADGSLPTSRVAEAARRVRATAEAATTARAAATVPPTRTDVVDDEVLIASFDISPAARSWRDRAGGTFGVVRLDAEPNVAVGVVPWGPDLAVADDGTGPVLVLGRDIHRRSSARAWVDRLRATRDTLVVDLGWPSADRAYADVATFGASRRVGDALRAWLEHRPH